jgi:hypothetical protein
VKKARCCKCGRALTDPFSIALGMGPECRGSLSKRGWKFPKPRYRVQHGHVILIGMDGKIVEPPPVGDTSTRSVRRLTADRKRKVKRGNKNEGR